jgi:hypothetical protein
MKKFICLIVFCVLALSSLNAQTQKGTFYIGALGSASNIFDSEDSDGTISKTQTQYNFSAGINAGYFIKNNFSLGFTGIYSSKLQITPNTIPSNTENITWSAPIQLALHARKYCMPTPKFGIYAQLRGGIITGTTRNMLRVNESNLLLSEANLSGFASALGAGITWFPFKKAKRFNVDVLINVLEYQAITTNYNAPSSRDTEINTAFSFFSTTFGINYYIFKDREPNKVDKQKALL